MKFARPRRRPPSVRPPPRPRGARFSPRRPPAVPAAPRRWRWPLRFGGLRRVAGGVRAPPAGGAGAGRPAGGGASEAGLCRPFYSCKPWRVACYRCKLPAVYICKPPLSIAGVNPVAAAVAIALLACATRLASRSLCPRSRSRPPAMPRAPAHPARPWRLPVRLPVALAIALPLPAPAALVYPLCVNGYCPPPAPSTRPAHP